MSSKKETRAEAVDQRRNEEPAPENDEIWYDAVEQQSEIDAVLTTRSSSWFPVLPTVILQILVDLVDRNDKKSLIRLASCDRFLQNLIYREFSFLWETIDLQQLHGINDTQLHALLERVNAKYVTKSISLDRSDGRTLISGVGLMPLTNSQVLESADLRQDEPTSVGPTGLEDMLVAGIFRSMLPYKLESVKVRENRQYSAVPFGGYTLAWGDVLANLRIKQSRQVLSDHSPCSHCGVVLARLNPDTETVLKGSSTSTSIQCTQCKKLSCKAWDRGSSCPAIKTCPRCLDASCPCNPMLRCEGCGITSCTKCEAVVQCQRCSKSLCTRSFVEGMMDKCSRCNTILCSECESMLYCEICKDTICQDCSGGASCICGCQICARCLDQVGGLQRCDRCEGIVGCCLEAHELCNSTECICKDRGRTICSECRNCYSCDTCGRWLCESSEDVRTCEYCDVPYCVNCQDTCQDVHECHPPGYCSRPAQDGDEQKSLCSCGKRSFYWYKGGDGQQFICKKQKTD